MKINATTHHDDRAVTAKVRSAFAIRASSFFRHSGLLIRHCLLLLTVLLPLSATAQQTEHADDAPLAFPPMEHYAKLWENSMFTTKALPPPDDAPKGPLFTDALTLVGIYEVDGGVVGVLLDKTTSQVMEVRIGAENDAGIKIARVTPGATADKTKLQLQKGQEAGWVTFAADSAPPPDQPATGQPGGPGPAGVQLNSAIPGRPVVPQPNAQGQPNPLLPLPRKMAEPPPRNQPVATPPPVIPQPAVVPTNTQSTGAAQGGDIPLPPQ